MRSLDPEAKKIILDFYFRCGPDEDIDRACTLIAEDSRAAELYSKLETSLKQLDAIKYEPCPDNLADLTIARLKVAASQKGLENLLEQEQRKGQQAEIGTPTTSRSFWRVMEVMAAAAVVLLVFTVYQPVCTRMRHNSWQKRCSAGLGRMGAGMGRYANDNDGRLPYVARSAGAPWWKVGEQGRENHSNTRYLWLVVKEGYVDSKDCVCAGRKSAYPIQLDKAQLRRLNDFPNRHALSYSFMFMCEKAAHGKLSDKKIVLADVNPVFEDIFDTSGRPKKSEFDMLCLNEPLKMMLSKNHNERGQNVLLGSGSVVFTKSRLFFGDDIYTVRGAEVYRGIESPCDELDTFLIP